MKRLTTCLATDVGIVHGCLLLLAGLWCAGCDESLARERVSQRHENLVETAHNLQEIEAGRARGPSYSLNAMLQQHERDRRNARENLGKVDRMVQKDIQRWFKRQPDYQRQIEQELRGDPQNIKRTAPLLAY